MEGEPRQAGRRVGSQGVSFRIEPWGIVGTWRRRGVLLLIICKQADCGWGSGDRNKRNVM